MGTKWNLILENIPSFRESLNDDPTVNNLPVRYGQILTISGGKYGVSAGESVFVFMLMEEILYWYQLTLMLV